MTRTTKDFMKFINQLRRGGESWRTPTKSDKVFYDIYYWLYKNKIIDINNIDDMRNILDNSVSCWCNTEYINKNNCNEFDIAEQEKQLIKKYNNIILLHYFDGSNIKACNYEIPNGYFKACKHQEQDKKRFLIVGAKWWDKVNGNTYNSSIIIDNKTNKKYYIPFEYGYGEDYKHRALNYLKENNIIDYKIDYTNYESVCMGYIKKADVKKHTYY